MAILHADNFSIYGTNTALMLNGIYAQVDGCTLSDDPDGVSPGKVLQPNWGNAANFNNNWRYPSQTGGHTKGGAAFRIWQTVLPDDDTGKAINLSFRTASNATMAEMFVLSNGGLAMRTVASDGTRTDYKTTIPAITANAWYHLEATYEISGAGTCTFEVRVEGLTVIREEDVASGWDPSDNPNVGQYSARWEQINNPQQYFIKDLVLYDNTGSYNTDFIGSVIVANLSPTSDVELNWTPSTGTTGWEILDNIPPTDGQYISAPYSPTDPHFPDTYVATLSDLPVEATSVKALITFVRAAKSDGGDGGLQVGVISDPDGTPATALGADRPITVAQTYWRDVFETDPKTSAPWLPAAVNDAELQLNRTT